MLNDPVLAVLETVAPLVTFIDMVASDKVEIPQTSKCILSSCVWKDFLPQLIFFGVVETLAVKVFACIISGQ